MSALEREQDASQADASILDEFLLARTSLSNYVSVEDFVALFASADGTQLTRSQRATAEELYKALEAQDRARRREVRRNIAEFKEELQNVDLSRPNEDQEQQTDLHGPWGHSVRTSRDRVKALAEQASQQFESKLVPELEASLAASMDELAQIADVLESLPTRPAGSDAVQQATQSVEELASTLTTARATT